MTFKKSLYLLFLIAIAPIYANGQQLPQLTQYMMNNYAINPAVAGMQDYYQIRTTIRNQWIGIEDAPTTNILSVYGKRGNNVGLGGIVFNDQVGPTSRIGANMSYTYHFNLSKKTMLALSLSGGFTQFKIDKLGWNVQHPDDPVTQGDVIVDAIPDATFGFNFYGKNWYLGGSVPQLVSSNLELLDTDFARNFNTEMTGSLSPHVYVLGAYQHTINGFWNVEPSVLVKYMDPTPTQFDIGLKTEYNDRLWAGLNYRSNGDIAALFGYNIGERFIVGYSYDIVNADINDYSSSSHEFMIGINFVPVKEQQLID